MSAATNPSTPTVTLRQALRRFKRDFVAHSAAQEIMEQLEKLYMWAAPPTDRDGDGFGECEKRIFLLTGVTGSGKSALLKEFCRGRLLVEEELRDCRPIVYLEVVAKPTRKAMMHLLLAELKAFVPRNMPEASLTLHVTRILRAMGVRMLILDEAQHLFDRESRKFAYDTADWVKGLANAGISVVLAGLPETADVYVINDQLRRRSFDAKELRPFDLDDEDGSEGWTEVLEDLVGRFPLRNAEFLLGEVISERLNAVSGGCVGQLVDFLYMLALEALGENPGDISAPFPPVNIELLLAAGERLRDLRNPRWVNPFDLTKPLPEKPKLEAEAEAEPPVVDRKTRLRAGNRRPRASDLRAA